MEAKNNELPRLLLNMLNKADYIWEELSVRLQKCGIVPRHLVYSGFNMSRNSHVRFQVNQVYLSESEL